MAKTVGIVLGYLLIYLVLGSQDSDENDAHHSKVTQMLANRDDKLPGLCRACKWVVEKVRKVLPQDADQDDIKQQLKTVCNKISFMKSMCKRFVSKYLSKLATEIASADDAKTACVHLKACK